MASDDTACTLLVSSQRLIARRFATLTLTAAQLDSLKRAFQLGRKQPYNGQAYLVQPLADGSFPLRWQRLDTLAELGAPQNTQLRRYRGWYYLSAQTDAGTWAVERLAFAHGRLHWQEFNRDSLHIKALPLTTVSLVRRKQQVLFTLNPVLGPVTRQVNGYQGVWLTKADYLRRNP